MREYVYSLSLSDICVCERASVFGMHNKMMQVLCIKTTDNHTMVATQLEGHMSEVKRTGGSHGRSHDNRITTTGWSHNSGHRQVTAQTAGVANRPKCDSRRVSAVPLAVATETASSCR